jgi:hypothetical protein
MSEMRVGLLKSSETKTGVEANNVALCVLRHRYSHQ